MLHCGKNQSSNSIKKPNSCKPFNARKDQLADIGFTIWLHLFGTLLFLDLKHAHTPIGQEHVFKRSIRFIDGTLTGITTPGSTGKLLPGKDTDTLHTLHNLIGIVYIASNLVLWIGLVW